MYIKMFKRRQRTVLINNYYQKIRPRGIIAYVDDIEQYLESNGISYRTLKCPRFMESWRKQGIWFHLFEQIYVPLVGFRYKIVIYPYNSAAVLAIFHSGSLLIVHDFIAYKRKLCGYSAPSAKAVRWTQRVYEISGRKVAYITKDVERQARYIKKFRNSTTYILPNTFLKFRQYAATTEPKVNAGGEFILLCTGKVPTKDLEGAIQLYLSSGIARGYKLLILGASGADARVNSVGDQASETRDLIELLPIISSQKLIELYKCATAVWVHSVSEGFGRNIAEALICRAKVIASDISPFRKQAMRSRNVYLYRNGDQRNFDTVLSEVIRTSRFSEDYESNVSEITQTFSELLAP